MNNLAQSRDICELQRRYIKYNFVLSWLQLSPLSTICGLAWSILEDEEHGTKHKEIRGMRIYIGCEDGAKDIIHDDWPNEMKD